MADIVALTGSKITPTQHPLQQLTASGMEAVNHLILKRMQSDIPLIPALAQRLVADRAKQIYPMLTLAAAELAGYRGSRHVKLAAAIEFINTAMMLHENVFDEYNMRNVTAAIDPIFGNPAKVLIGSFLLSRSFELMVEDGDQSVLRILSSTSRVIAEGKVDALAAARQIDTDEEQYFRIIGARVATLFAAATSIAAVVAEMGEAKECALQSYGFNLGVATQLNYDATDCEYETGQKRNDKGCAIGNGMMTLPVILAYARGNSSERAFWKELVAGHRTMDHDLCYAALLVDRHNTVNATRERARIFSARAIDALSIFPPSEARTMMCEVAESSAKQSLWRRP